MISNKIFENSGHKVKFFWAPVSANLAKKWTYNEWTYKKTSL